MMLSLDENLFRNSNLLKFSSEDYFFKKSKVKDFGDILYRKGSPKTEFVLQTHQTNRNTRVANNSIRIYEDVNTFLS